MWYHFVAFFFGGAFFVNAIPHFTNGVSGHMFPTPFASPPGKGLSPAVVNVLWGSLNLLIGYMLVFRVGTFDFRRTPDALIAGVGGLLMAIMLSRTFAGIHPLGDLFRSGLVAEFLDQLAGPGRIGRADGIISTAIRD